MTLNEILQKVKEVRPFASEDTDSGPIETLTARRGRKTQAIEALTQLKREYQAELRKTAAFIVVVGDKRNEFVTTATESYKCFSADPNTYFNQLIDRIPPSSYLGKESVANLFDILGRHMEDLGHELNMREYNQLIFKQEYYRHVGSRSDFLKLIREAITEQLGGELAGIQAVASLTPVLIEKESAAKFTPILLPTDDEAFAIKMANDLMRLNSRVFFVSVGEATKKPKTNRAFSVSEPTPENVKKVLKKISDFLKSFE